MSFCRGTSHSAEAPAILQRHQPFCRGTSHSAEPPAILQRHQPFCRGTSHSAEAPAILQRHQPFCRGTSHSAEAPAILQRHQPFCGGTSHSAEAPATTLHAPAYILRAPTVPPHSIPSPPQHTFRTSVGLAIAEATAPLVTPAATWVHSESPGITWAHTHHQHMHERCADTASLSHSHLTSFHMTAGTS